MWGLHDFSLQGAQGGESFRGIIEKNYGGADNVADWLTLAQFVNYDGYRAMFEAHAKNRMGLLLWMTHPAWPSFVWQTYDYYFEPTAAYFGAKKANEPLHIQWNPVTDNVDVVNYSAGAAHGTLGPCRGPQSRRLAEMGEDGDGRQRRRQHRHRPEDRLSRPASRRPTSSA